MLRHAVECQVESAGRTRYKIGVSTGERECIEQESEYQQRRMTGSIGTGLPQGEIQSAPLGREYFILVRRTSVSALLANGEHVIARLGAVYSGLTCYRYYFRSPGIGHRRVWSARTPRDAAAGG
jgi:hypothetical protein